MSGPLVVGYIPSPEGEAALDRALKEAAVHGAKLYVVNVVHDDGSTIDDRYVPREIADRIRARLEGTGAEFEMIKTESPNVADAILEIAEQYDAKTIVLGLRKRSRVGKLILGSIAQRILMDSQTSVLAVRAD